jgi:hypothetical protein
MRYTKEQLAFLRDGFQRMTVAELTDAFNARYGLHQARSAIHSTIGRENITRARRILPGRRLSFTQGQVKFIRENYRRLPLRELVVAFNERFGVQKTLFQMKCFITNHRIRSGRTGCFPRGHVPMNKDTKGLTGANVTSFKKGNNPPNRKPIGTERINKYGYIEVKVAERNPYTGSPTRYRLKHRVLWEAVNGPVPAGKIVIFIDGDKAKCSGENLACITRAEGVRLNQFGYTDLPDDLKPSMLALVQLKVKAFDRLREKVGDGR